MIVAATAFGLSRRSGDDPPPAPGPRPFTLAGTAGPVSVSFARFSPRTLAVARSGGQVAILDADPGHLQRTIDLHEPGTTLAAFDLLDQDLLATGGPSGVVRLWHYPDGRPLLAFPDQGSGPITQLLFDPGNRHQLAAVRGQVLTVWDTGLGRRLRDLAVGPAVTALAYDPLTRNTLAVARQDGTVTVWDSSTGRRVRALQGRFGRIAALAFDPLTRNTLATGEATGAVRIWDSSTGRPVRTIRCAVPVGSMAFNPLIRNSLATGNSDGGVRIWDSSTGLPVHTLTGGAVRVNSLAYATDGRKLAAGSDDGAVTVWPVEDWH